MWQPAVGIDAALVADINDLLSQNTKQTTIVIAAAGELIANVMSINCARRRCCSYYALKTFGLKVQELPKGEDKKNTSEPRVQVRCLRHPCCS